MQVNTCDIENFTPQLPSVYKPERFCSRKLCCWMIGGAVVAVVIVVVVLGLVYGLQDNGCPSRLQCGDSFVESCPVGKRLYKIGTNEWLRCPSPGQIQDDWQCK